MSAFEFPDGFVGKVDLRYSDEDKNSRQTFTGKMIKLTIITIHAGLSKRRRYVQVNENERQTDR